MPHPHRIAATAAAVALLGTCIAAGTSTAATAPDASFTNASLACAWPVESTPTKANVLYPDSNATYWTTPYVATPGMTITVTGKYPTARFFSVNTYSSNAQSFTRNGVPSALSDFEIAPTVAGQNGWQTPGAPNGGAYTVTLRNAVKPGIGNVIPL